MDQKTSDDSSYKDCQPERKYSRAQELVNNLPYIVMLSLGAAIFLTGFEKSAWSWLLVGVYLIYGVGGVCWIMIFICPYCAYWGTRSCPCGYGAIAAKLREKGTIDQFNQKFRKHIWMIVPLWFIPLLAGVPIIIRSFSWPMLLLLAAFVLDAFVILPLLSVKHGCKGCPQRSSCPWMRPKTNRL